MCNKNMINIQCVRWSSEKKCITHRNQLYEFTTGFDFSLGAFVFKFSQNSVLYFTLFVESILIFKYHWISTHGI